MKRGLFIFGFMFLLGLGVLISAEDSCTETDGGYNIGKKGSIEIFQTFEYGDSSISNTDSCFDSSIEIEDGTTSKDLLTLFLENNLNLEETNKVSGEYLLETTCAGYTVDGETIYSVAVSYKCPNGCKDGACIEDIIEITCKDTNDYNTKGNITLDDGKGFILSVEDSCLADLEDLAKEHISYSIFLQKYIDEGIFSNEELGNKNILLESYCPSDTYSSFPKTQVLSKTYECPNGCEDGACIKLSDDEEEPTIQQTTTSQQPKFYIQNKEVNVEGTILEVDGESVKSFLNIVEEDSKIYVKTSMGDKEIKILPEEAIFNANKIENVNEIVIGQEDGEAVYLISGTKKARLFFIFSIIAEVEQKINVEDGELVSIKKPWWSFLALGI